MSALPRALPIATARSRRPGRLKSLVVYGSALTIVLFVLFPLYWIVVNSLRPESELARTGLSYVPTAPTLQNYGNVISSRFPYFQLLRNSLVVAAGTAAISLVVAVAAAYAAARYRFRGRDAFLLVILLSYLIPQVLLLVPMYVILRDLGLLNTYPGLIVAHSTSAVPFAIWMLTGYFKELPRELEEAAWIDGAGWLHEPPREKWRLHSMRGWSDEQTRQVSTGSARACGAAGAGAPGGVSVGMGGGHLDRREAGRGDGGVAPVAAAGRD